MAEKLQLKKGDRILILCQGYRLTGTVINAQNHPDRNGDDWHVEYDHDTNGYAYWKQQYDGGTVTKL